MRQTDFEKRRDVIKIIATAVLGHGSAADFGEFFTKGPMLLFRHDDGETYRIILKGMETKRKD